MMGMFLLLSMFYLFSLMNLFTHVNSLYKWGVVSVFSFLFFLVSNYSNMSYVLFVELRMWLYNSPLFVFDFNTVLFFILAMMVSWSIMVFSVDYMVGEKSVMSFLSFLFLFLFFMFLLVFSNSFMVLFISWEGVGLLSYVLITWWSSRSAAINSSMQAVIYNRVGDAGLLLFLVLYLVLSNSLILSDLFSLNLIFLMFFLSVMAKSSQFLFHPWLPNAMESPTPVSSLLHSSTMVVAGVLLMMRAIEMMENSLLVFCVGLLTCLLSGVMSFMQFDFKKVVAYSTTSQLGFMLMMLGLGFSKFCILYMMIHSFFKAMIFMVSGVVIHMCSSAQDFRSMGVIILMNKFMSFLFMLSSLVMMGLPFVSGFWVKDLVLENTVFSFLSVFFWVFYVTSVFLTSFYSLRLYLSLFNVTILSHLKMFMYSSVMSAMPFARLFMSSVLASLFLFISYSPFSHVMLGFLSKVFGFMVVFMSMSLMFFYIKGLHSNLKVGFIYLFFYNPMVHKFMTFLGMGLGKYMIMLDMILMEAFYFSNIQNIRHVIMNYRFVFLILFSFFMIYYLF